MQYEDTIEIRGVTVVRQTDVALLCRMANQHRWIAPTQFQQGSTVARQGDVGIIVLKRPFAVEQVWSPSKDEGSMTEPLAVGTGDRVTFPAVMGAGDLNLIGLVNGKQVAVPPFLVPAGEHRRVAPSTPWQDRHPEVARPEPGA